MNYLSVCSGIEAASVAWHPLSWEAVGFSEIESFPSRVLKHHYPDVRNHGDFTAIDVDDLPLVDILVGGTPCQAFSVAGLRKSLADARGNLTLSFVRLAHELAAKRSLRNAVWENVPGVLSTHDGAFGCFLGGLVGADDPVIPSEKPKRGKSNDFWRWQAAGRFPVLDDYGNETGEFVERPEGHVCRWPDAGMVAGPRARAAWRILDAQHHGLAQRRRRVFVVADFGNGADPAKVLFERKGMRGNSAPSREAGQDVAGTLSARTQGGGGLGTDFELGGWLVAYGGNNCAGPIDVATALNAHGGPVGRLDFESETFVTHALRGEGFDASEDGTGRGTPIVPICFGSKDYGADAVIDIAPTLRSGGHDKSHANAGVPPAIAAHYGVRRLTPRECERLQGFPDDFTAIPGAADGPRYKALGNSMAVPVMRWIGERIARFMPVTAANNNTAPAQHQEAA
jgi:DNA (cytosine-5)-methyltransferase 1